MSQYVAQALQVIRSKTDFSPQIAIVCGSGLGQLADLLSDVVAISYTDLPGFPSCSVDGHAGQLLLGTLAGCKVACLQGRTHFYEGVAIEVMRTPLRTMRKLGCETVLITNSSGSLQLENPPGSLVLVRDHINLQFDNPLIGENDSEFGPRFVAMDNAYDSDLRAMLQAAAKQLGGSGLSEGVYIGVSGPSFETPAEIEAFRRLGADLVGMSTVADVIIARHCGLKVATISVVTNLAAGMHHQSLSHTETLSAAASVL